MIYRPRLCFAFVCLALVPIPAPAEPIKPGPNTTILTEPLNPDGTVDYIAAMNREMGEGVTPENNAFAGIADLMGGAEWAWPNPEHRRLVYEQLGKPIPDGNQATFVPIEAFARARGKDPDKASDQMYKATDQPWTADEFPLVDAWLNHNAAALDRLAAVVRRPGYFSPLVCEADRPQTIKAAFLPTLGFYRYLGWLLFARMDRALGRGDTAQAVHDFLLMLRLSRLPGRQPQQWSVLTGISLVQMAGEAIVTLLDSPDLKPADLSRLAKGMRRMPPLPPVGPTVKHGERLAALDMVQQLAKGRYKTILWEQSEEGDRHGSDYYKPVFRQLKPFVTSPAYDLNRTLRRVNLEFDAIPLVDSMPSFFVYTGTKKIDEFGLRCTRIRTDDKVKQGLARQASDSPTPEQRRRLAQFVDDLAVVCLVDHVAGLVEVDQEARMLDKLMRAAVRLKKYQLRYGHFPDRLLKPMTDFNGLPVTYRLEPKHMLLYSIGADLKNDDGKFKETKMIEGDWWRGDLPIQLKR